MERQPSFDTVNGDSKLACLDLSKQQTKWCLVLYYMMYNVSIM
jgi:hypothetical protein